MQQAYLSGSTNLQQSGTPLLNAISWRLWLPSTLLMFYVFHNTTHSSPQYFMALQPISVNMLLSILIPRSGWHSKTHLRDFQRVSIFIFGTTSFLTIFNSASSFIQSASTSQSASAIHASTIQYIGDSKTSHSECSRASAQGAPCMFTFYSCMVYFLRLFFQDTKPWTTQSNGQNKFSPFSHFLLNSCLECCTPGCWPIVLLSHWHIQNIAAPQP